MLSTDVRDMMAKEVWACRPSTFIRLTMRAPVLMMILSIIFWVAAGAYALVRKPPKVETDVAGFSIRDHPTARLKDAIWSAESESEFNWDAMLTAGGSASVGTIPYVTSWLDSGGYLTSPSAVRKMRRLQSYVATERPNSYSSFQLVYTSTRGENVLREEVMKFALDLEGKITRLPGLRRDDVLADRRHGVFRLERMHAAKFHSTFILRDDGERDLLQKYRRCHHEFGVEGVVCLRRQGFRRRERHRVVV